MDVVQKVAEAIRARDSQDEFAIARAAIAAYQDAIWPVRHFSDRMTVEIRRNKANALTAHVMNVISKYLCDHGDTRGHQDASRALMQLFYESGADIITDADRAAAGLPARGPSGLTDQELQIMEARRVEMMLKPLAPMFLER